jgi:starch phosphorylase
MEASGTSGEKAVLNGALHCSVLDGWWAECFLAATNGDEANGWAISSAEAVADEHRRAELEANSLFELLETQIVPCYHDGGEVPTRWLARVRASVRTLGPFVGAHRMVRDYVEHLYLPAAHRATELERDGHRGARELAAFGDRLAHCWHRVHVDSVEVDESIADLGSERTVDAVVALGELHPEEVDVQLVVGHVGQSGELESPTARSMSVSGTVDDQHVRYRGTAVLDAAGRMGVTVRVVPRHELVDAAVEFGRVAWAG